MTADQRAVMAAKNSADWYSMMFDVHRLRYERSNLAFRAIDQSPPYHSSMVVLEPQCSDALTDLVSAGVATTAGFGINDAFHNLTLGGLGLRELFSASWIWADAPPSRDHTAEHHGEWEQVTTANDLLLWEAAWKAGGSPSEQTQFPEPVLSRDDVAIWGRRASGGFDVGLITNRSDDCVGVSNTFGRGALAAAAGVCAEFAPGLPIVGYERGDDLAIALNCGFTAVGPLRVAVLA